MTTFGYQLRRISGPEVEPVTVAEVKRQCRIDDDLTDNDEDLAFWISTAREMAEVYCKRTFATSTWVLQLPNWPSGCDPADGLIPIPNGPLIEIVSVKYLDTNREYQVIDLTDPDMIQVAQYAEPPWIAPGRGGSQWPRAFGSQGAIEIEYRAGYLGDGSPEGVENVPNRVKQAIRMCVGHWYENRETVVAETRIVPVKVPFGFEELLDGLKVYP